MISVHTQDVLMIPPFSGIQTVHRVNSVKMNRDTMRQNKMKRKKKRRLRKRDHEPYGSSSREQKRKRNQKRKNHNKRKNHKNKRKNRKRIGLTVRDGVRRVWNLNRN